MSLTSANLAFMIKISQFTDAKLESAKSVKNNMIDQQQNSDDIIDLFDMSNQLSKASLNEASSNEVPPSKAPLNKVSSSDSEAAKLSALYQCLDHSHVNIQMWHHRMCHMGMYKVLKLRQITRDIDINSMSASKQLCEVCIQDKSHKYVSKAF